MNHSHTLTFAKPLIIILNTVFLVLLTQVTFAQNILESNASLLDATIYSRGAELHHTAKQIKVPAGNSEIVINRISKNVDAQSIRVTSSNGQLTILSVSFENDYLNKGGNKSAIYLDIQKRYDDANSILNDLINQRKGEESTLALLEENRKFGGQSGVTPVSIANMIKYYRDQYKVIADNIVAFKAKEEAQQKIVDKLKSQMDEAGGNGQNAGQLVLRVNSPSSLNADFNINYFTNSVSWSPFYEIRVDNLKEPLQLIYKANVAQNTGIDWKQIKLTFASGNPRQNNNAPELSPWWLSFNTPIRSRPTADLANQLQGRVAGVTVNETVVVAYGANKDMAQVQDNQLNSSFVIETPYDIYSNGKPQSVQLQSYRLPAEYSYYTAPRADESSFLIGKITDWAKLNLLAGNANLIIDNNYAGTSYINPKSINDTLTLSLGRDERIITKRTRINEEGSTSFLGNSQKRVYTYEIALRNTRNEAVDIEVKEQFPLSTEKDIEIKLEEVSGAKINKEKGELGWNLNLKPGETKKLIVSYSIKYPRDKNIAGL